MVVLNVEPVANQGGGGMRVLAFFDLTLNPDVKMYGLRLMEAPDGRRIVYSPNANGGRRTATFSPAMASAITAAAIAKFEGHETADEQRRTS